MERAFEFHMRALLYGKTFLTDAMQYLVESLPGNKKSTIFTHSYWGARATAGCFMLGNKCQNTQGRLAKALLEQTRMRGCGYLWVAPRPPTFP